MWGFTGLWLFGAMAVFNLLSVYLGLEARAVCRMIRRDGTQSGQVAPVTGTEPGILTG